MDLSTTTKIKRRFFNIAPSKTENTTECTINTVNWFQGKNLSTMKLKIESFFLNNAALPCFIPKYRSSFPASGFQDNKGMGGTITEYNSIFNADSIDYYINVHNVVTKNNTTIYMQMNSNYSEYAYLKPSNHPVSTFAQYNNKYYWIYNTSRFCELVASHINQLLVSLGKTYVCDIVRTAQGYGLYMPDTFYTTDNFEIQFSESLINLFQFRNIESENSTNLKTIIFNTQKRVYNTVNSFYVASNYIPDIWFPFDLILFKTTLPLEPESFYTNSNYISEDYQNVILSFKISNSNPDGIYNFYTSEISPDASWCSMRNTNNGDNAKIEILLRFRETGDSIPYIIKPSEKAYFTTMEIDTIPPY